jgi:hypothetical protein
MRGGGRPAHLHKKKVFFFFFFKKKIFIIIHDITDIQSGAIDLTCQLL